MLLFAEVYHCVYVLGGDVLNVWLCKLVSSSCGGKTSSRSTTALTLTHTGVS